MGVTWRAATYVFRAATSKIAITRAGSLWECAHPGRPKDVQGLSAITEASYVIAGFYPCLRVRSTDAQITICTADLSTHTAHDKDYVMKPTDKFPKMVGDVWKLNPRTSGTADHAPRVYFKPSGGQSQH